VEIHSVNWINEPSYQQKLQARYRHQGELIPIKLGKLGRGHYSVKFNKAQKAVASGQSLVLYSGKICLGGGVIV
jgi:tRNA-specific 2-thiouridylase